MAQIYPPKHHGHQPQKYTRPLPPKLQKQHVVGRVLTVKQVGFITQGVLRVFYYNNKGEEITRYFIDENHLILSGHTGEGMYIPSEYLSAVSDCTLIVFPHRNWTELLEIIIGLDQIVQRIVARQHKEKVSRRSEMITQSAKERYLDFIH